MRIFLPCLQSLFPCSRSLVQLIVVSVVPLLACAASHAQATTAESSGSTAGITGVVLDPQGAVMPQAQITLTPRGGTSVPVMVDKQGHFSLTGLASGTYSLEARADGFRLARKDNLHLADGAVQRITFEMEIEEEQQQVEVTDATSAASPEKNGSAITLKGRDLQALSDNQSEMQQQLQAIAGSDPEAGAQFYVDGFSSGKLPPKSSIREIRINQNPYSAQYDELGYGRIEIFTKPGTDKLHGSLWMQGNDSSMNTQNPFISKQPPYHSFQFEGGLNGPLTKVSSFFASIYRQSAATNAIVNAEVLDTSLNPVSFKQAINAPVTNLDLTPRFDLQLGKAQTISLRYEIHRNTQTNGGVGQLSLAAQAFNTENTQQILQFSDTQAYGPKIVNEMRFQYVRDRNSQIAQTKGATIAVQGAFTGGGSSQGVSRDNQDHYEFQDYLQLTAGKHDLNLGVRLRALRDSNYSTANFNGQYTFASLAAYRITEQGLRDGLTPTAIRSAGGGASQYNQTQGKPAVAVTQFDAGLFAEDNWKLNPSVTLSYGLRFESQDDIHDHADIAPRLALAWSISGGKNKPPRAVIRTGTGWFYQRFASTNVLQTQRQNGITQSAFVVNAPDFYPADCVNNPTACTTAASAAASSPTIYRLNPNLRAPYIWMSGIGVDKPLGKHANVSANYLYSRGEHLLLTRNINAPLPGTYNPADPSSGTRPLGTNENIYDYESDGTSSRHRLIVNGNVQAKHLGLYSYYMLGKMETNTAGVASFPSNSYDLHQDYGRGSGDVHSRLFLGGFAEIPGKVSINPFIIYQSSTPFNIVLGQDLNGDTQFNDRPAFATDLTRASVYKTKYGIFDADPIPGQKIIPINYASGPGLFVANLNIMKNFAFGPVIPDETPAPAPEEKDKAAKEKKTETKTSAKKEVQHKYNLGVGVSSNNIFNHVNLAQPVGVLGSTLFGKSTALASPFGSGVANRTINLNLYFEF